MGSVLNNSLNLNLKRIETFWDDDDNRGVDKLVSGANNSDTE